MSASTPSVLAIVTYQVIRHSLTVPLHQEPGLTGEIRGQSPAMKPRSKPGFGQASQGIKNRGSRGGQGHWAGCRPLHQEPGQTGAKARSESRGERGLGPGFGQGIKKNRGSRGHRASTAWPRPKLAKLAEEKENNLGQHGLVCTHLTQGP